MGTEPPTPRTATIDGVPDVAALFNPGNGIPQREPSTYEIMATTTIAVIHERLLGA